MLFLLDTANLEKIKSINDYYPVDGVTTNPTIIGRECREKQEIPFLLKQIKSIIGPDKMLHIQVTSDNAEEMLAEAEAIKTYMGNDVYIKVPVIPEGIKAMTMMSREKFNLTATAVFTPQQALIAAKAGADFVAPYVNRLDDLSVDGVRVVSEILRLFTVYKLKTKVLAASFKNIEQIHRTCLSGADALTVSPDLFGKMVFHPLTELSVETFKTDWAAINGENQGIGYFIRQMDNR